MAKQTAYVATKYGAFAGQPNRYLHSSPFGGEFGKFSAMAWASVTDGELVKFTEVSTNEPLIVDQPEQMNTQTKYPSTYKALRELASIGIAIGRVSAEISRTKNEKKLEELWEKYDKLNTEAASIGFAAQMELQQTLDGER